MDSNNNQRDEKDTLVRSTDTNEKSFVVRQELTPILQALDYLTVDQDHPSLINVTGSYGSGKTKTLYMLSQQGQALGITSLLYSLSDIIDTSASLYSRVDVILRLIAEGVGVNVKEWDQQDKVVPLGVAQFRERGRQIRDSINKNPDLKLLLLLDVDTVTNDVDRLLLLLENSLFIHLENKKRVLIVVGSSQGLQWRLQDSSVLTIELHPFTVKQIQQQLGCSIRMAKKIWAITGGLPGANVWLLQQDSLETATSAELFHQIFQSFIVPVIGTNSLLIDTARAISLMPAGFDPTELQALVRNISYLRGRYLNDGKSHIYTQIDLLVQIGIAAYDRKDGKFYLESNLRALLERWNYYMLPEEENLANRAFIASISQHSDALLFFSDAHKGKDSSVKPNNSTPGNSLQPAKEPSQTTSGFATESADAYYQNVYEYLSKNMHRPFDKNYPSDLPFVGRADPLIEVARHLCRREGRAADIIFVQGSPGSGKTEILDRFLTLARAAAKECLGEGLVVPVPELYNRGIIDLEFSSTNKLNKVREVIKFSLIKAFSDRGMSEEEVGNFFAEYDAVQTHVDSLRNQLRSENQYKQVGTAHDKAPEIRMLQKQLDREFFTACHNLAKTIENPRRRILLVFDTFDYPVRSGQHAPQFISEVAARLAGDYCILISCRPPIGIEKIDPYLAGDLQKYLPDDLHNQTALIDLDKRYELKFEDIKAFYEGSPWYKNTNLASKESLAHLMAQVMDQHGKLPVTLNLLEFYVGIYDEKLPKHLANNIEDLVDLDEERFQIALIVGLLHSFPESKDQISRPHELALLCMSIIDRGLSKKMLASILDALVDDYRLPPGGITGIWNAVQFFRYLDNPKTLSSTLMKIIPAVEDKDLEDASQILLMHAPADYSILENSSQINGDTVENEAYKLHDYASTLFNHYIVSRVAEPGVVNESAFNIIAKREAVLIAVINYLYKLGQENVLAPEAIVHNPETLKRQGIYRTTRSMMLYYIFRLAAVRYATEKLSGTKSLKEVPNDFPDLHNPKGLLNFNSAKLINYLNVNYEQLSAAKIAELGFAYLYSKIVREISNSLAYEFTEMLLQEVRYHLYNQGNEKGRLVNLILPLLDAKEDPRHEFEHCRHLYYAAMLTWEHSSGKYSSPDPWLEEMKVDHIIQDAAEPTTDALVLSEDVGWLNEPKVYQKQLRNWRKDSEWRAISSLLQLNERIDPGSQAFYQERYAKWLADYQYPKRAHDAYALLMINADGVQRVELLLKKSEMMLKNLTTISYRGDDGVIQRGIKGIQAAELYLSEAMDLLEEFLAPVSLQAEVYSMLGFLRRLYDHLNWSIDASEYGAWSDTKNLIRMTTRYSLPLRSQIDSASNNSIPGASWYYDRALHLLTQSRDDHMKLLYTNVLIDYAYVLALKGEISAAESACKQLTDIWGDISHQSQSQDISQAVKDALGKLHYTYAEIELLNTHIDRYGEKDHTISSELVESALKHYQIALELFDPIDREWVSKIVAASSYAKFLLEDSRSLKKDVGTLTPDIERQLLQHIDEVKQVIYILFPKDRPTYYRYVARMYSRLAELNIASIEISESETNALSDVARRFTPRTEMAPSSARQAYVYLQRGYKLARAINDYFNILMMSSDTVELLALYSSPEETLRFYEERLVELQIKDEPTKSHQQRAMEGRSNLAIAFSYIKRIEKEGESDQVDKALKHIIAGFDVLTVRSGKDYHRLLKNIENFNKPEILQLFGNRLGYLYGKLEKHNFGPAWQLMLEAITTELLNQRTL